MVIPGPTLPGIMQHYSIPKQIGGLLPTVYFTGALVGTLSITHLMQKFDSRKILIIIILLLILSLIGFSLSPLFIISLLFFIFVGYANGILIAYPGILITNLSEEDTTSKLNFIYAFFALGVSIGPLIAGKLLSCNITFSIVYLIPAIIFLIPLISVIITSLPSHKYTEILCIKTIFNLTKENPSLFTGLILSLIFYISTEAGLSTWIPAYLLNKFKGKEDIFRASGVLTFLWIGLSLGRYICSYLSNKINPVYILLTITFLSTISILIGVWTDHQSLSELSFAITGLFLSGIYPILISYAKKFPSKYSSVVFSVLISAGAIGGGVFPYLVGLISELNNFSIGMTTIIIPLILLLFICSMLKYKKYI